MNPDLRAAHVSKRLVFLFAFLFSCAAFAADKEWGSYQPGNGACWVKFPANPEYQTQQAEGMTVHVYIGRDTQSPPSTYAISFGDFSQNKIPADKVAAEKVLDTERNNFVKAVNGKLQSEKATPIEGNPGRELTVTTDDGKAKYLVREYLIGARIFHLVVWMPASRSETGVNDAAKFFDSFQLGK